MYWHQSALKDWNQEPEIRVVWQFLGTGGLAWPLWALGLQSGGDGSSVRPARSSARAASASRVNTHLSHAAGCLLRALGQSLPGRGLLALRSVFLPLNAVCGCSLAEGHLVMEGCVAWRGVAPSARRLQCLCCMLHAAGCGLRACAGVPSGAARGRGARLSHGERRHPPQHPHEQQRQGAACMNMACMSMAGWIFH